MGYCFACCGLVVGLLGAQVFSKGFFTSELLFEHCSAAPGARELESAFTKLDAFYGKCDPTHTMPIRKCIGFNETFPPPAPMVRYLEILELNKHCAGFCRFAAMPL